jgi:hypothetical protein
MRTFVLCTVEVKHHNRVAFHKGHVYVAEQKTKNVEIMSDLDTLEIYPTHIFNCHFTTMMKHDDNAN